MIDLTGRRSLIIVSLGSGGGVAMSTATNFPKWADLPKELLQLIGKRLDSRIDVFRFRAVCSSWRSCVSPSHRQSLPQNNDLLLQIPHPINAKAFLSQSTICLLQQTSSNSSTSAAVAADSNTSWLTKVEESTRGDLELLIPLSNRQITPTTGITTQLPKKLNVLDFKLIELTKAYSLKLARGCCVFGVNKVVLFPKSQINENPSPDLLIIYHEGKLVHWRPGDGGIWTLIDPENAHYDDIIVYKNQMYVVDRLGTVSWIDSSLKLVQYSPPLFGCGTQKYLVESCGDLYVVDKYLDGGRRTWQEVVEEYGFDNNVYDMNDDFNFRHRNYPIFHSRTVEMRVYRLDEEWGRWVDVRSLGDRVFVLGNECCFSVSKQDLGGAGGNLVYFVDPDDVGCHGELSGYDAKVCNLEDGKIGKLAHSPECFHIFWPPPIGLFRSEKSKVFSKMQVSVQ